MFFFKKKLKILPTPEVFLETAEHIIQHYAENASS